MTLKSVLIAIAMTAFAVATAAAQTTTTQGAFDELSPGNQKIAQALCDGQPGGCPQTSSAGQKTLTRDQIAAMKQHQGWGEIFKHMKEQGLVQEKNLGQVISRANHQARSGSSGGTMITNGRGRTQVVEKPEGPGKSGKDHLENEARDDRGASMGRSGVGGHDGSRGK